MSKNKFTIDDAFETEDDETVRCYGTTESTPLKPKSSENVIVSVADPFLVKVEEPTKGKFGRLKITNDSLSKDSDSLIQSDVYGKDKYDSRSSWWKHPKVKENWKVMLAAFGLLFIGLGLLITGVVVQVLPDMGVQSFVFFIAGAICFIPGAYHVVYVYCAVKGKKGYDFYNLPLFN